MKNIVIIGAGVAGYSAALKLANHYHVTLIEQNLVGGTCVNTGCIPTKYYVEKRNTLNNFKRERNIFNGIDKISINLSELNNKRKLKIEKIRNSITKNLSKAKINFINDTATIKENCVITSDKKINFDILIIATGSQPLDVKNIFEIEKGAPVSNNSTQFMQIETIPEKLAIIGGGYIGLEFASIFNAFGSEVKVFEMSDSILSGFEKSSSKNIEARIKKTGISFFKNATVKKIFNDGKIEYVNKNNETITSEAFSHVFISIGRKIKKPEGLPLEYSNEGFIKVDGNFQTSMKNVYAIGDVIGTPFFAHRSAHHAYMLSNYLINGKTQKENISSIPMVIFTNPEVGKTGFDEDELKEKGIEYNVHKIPYGVLGKSVISDSMGQLKVITDKEDKIIGAILIGKNASELIGYMSYAIANNMKITDLKDIVLPHPTFSELYYELGLRV